MQRRWLLDLFPDLPIGDIANGYYYLFLTALLGILVFVTLWRASALGVPTVNSYPGDFVGKRAHEAYTSNAKGLLEEGIRKVSSTIHRSTTAEENFAKCDYFNNEPFRIITTLGLRIILPSSWTLWVKNCHDLDRQELVQEVC